MSQVLSSPMRKLKFREPNTLEFSWTHRGDYELSVESFFTFWIEY